ncbi:MAG: 2-oxoglutarate dehydrogenase, E2 component, dihydrolipoamide succinyltransferase [Gracilimonas sp.]|uniref:2-oxoglutarate dehydrogenase, E2 component, dihydrolipoamide succinyltransferase n=1 Tax=Gracilimonas sp. TaxID=1974203 RepID=UPI0019BD66A0|nr:2-oxoglutarate dehydrogenase, E2 component, dihydrolipoamide succinyltransferase [Gracilimonas sp.]MBD3617481.1 2-oxoglutarate dehydrogenase, E2 component, dihydrolipoamide succinyltransferase [Gracilimonas sp.]
MAKVEVVMPQMGESVMEGTVIEWTKQVGDSVEVDETLLEVATDKVDTEVPSPEAGVLVEILAEEGDVIEVGKAIAIIETDKDAAGDVSSGGSEEEKSEEPEEEETEEVEAQEEPAEDEAAPAASGGDEGERVEVQMPQMGESVVEATVIGWSKSVGDSVEEDETLLEISTDKVDSEVPSPVAGTLVEIMAEENDTIEVGQTIAVIATGKGASDPAAEKSAPKEEKKEKAAAAKQEKEPVAASSNGAPSSGGSEPQRMGSDGRFYSPLVRSIAKEEGISQEELEQIDGSGQGGRVSKKDILAYVEDRKAGKVSAPSQQKPAAKSSDGSISAGQLDVKHSPTGDVEVIKMDRMRKMIADHMVRSKQTSAHVTTFAEVDVTNMVKWRNANKAKFQEKTGTKLTFTPLFVEAIITAMLEFPLINSSVNGDEIHLKKDINFGLAVALGTGGEGGLIVPVIKQAQDKNLVGLAKAVNEVAEKARSKKLSPDDLVGGTITLTNYGSVGNLMGTPIINQPQVAIIGTGVIEKRPVVLETDSGDVIAIRQMMFLSMSYDHRIIDGAHGGAFLNRIKEILENFDMDRSV